MSDSSWKDRIETLEGGLSTAQEEIAWLQEMVSEHESRISLLEGATPPPPPPTPGLEVPDHTAPIPLFPERLFPVLSRPLGHMGYAPRCNGYESPDSDELIDMASMVCFGVDDVNGPAYQRIRQVNPDCKLLRYSMATKWQVQVVPEFLRYLDANGHSRTNGFVHASERYLETSQGYTSHPPDKFTSVNMEGDWRTSDAHNADRTWPGPAEGERLWIGKLDPFHIVNMTIPRGGTPGEWHYSLADGTTGPVPDEAIIEDTTEGGSQTGQLEVDVSQLAGWHACDHPHNPTKYEHYHYFLVLVGKGERSLLDRITYYDFTERGPGSNYQSPPLFDYEADVDGDGFLSPQERLNADPNKTAVFAWQDRVAAGIYWVDVANMPAREFMAERDLELAEVFDGIFYDVATYKLPHMETGSDEWARYQTAQGSFMRYVAEHLPTGKFVMQGSGVYLKYNPLLVQWLPITYDDRAWNPRISAGSFGRRCREQAERPEQLGGRMMSVLDWQGGDANCLSETVKYAGYCAYLVSSLNPHTDQYLAGGFNGDWTNNGTASGRSQWEVRHWCPAAEFDIGEPINDWQQKNVFMRSYQNALVLYNTADGEPNRQYGAKLEYDGSVSEPDTHTIQPGEGLILVR